MSFVPFTSSENDWNDYSVNDNLSYSQQGSGTNDDVQLISPQEGVLERAKSKLKNRIKKTARRRRMHSTTRRRVKRIGRKKKTKQSTTKSKRRYRRKPTIRRKKKKNVPRRKRRT